MSQSFRSPIPHPLGWGALALLALLLAGCVRLGGLMMPHTTRLDHEGATTRVSLATEVLADFDAPLLAGQPPAQATTSDAGAGWQRVSFLWQPAQPVPQDVLAVTFHLRLQPDLHWMPHLAPYPDSIVAQHVFRSPAIIAARGGRTLAIVPDLNLVGRLPGAPWFMDLDAPAGVARLALQRSRLAGHTFYAAEPGMHLPAGRIELAFFVRAWDDPATPANPWGPVAHFLWSRWGHPLAERGEPLRVPLDAYVRHTYAWAFHNWPQVWQEFDLAGRRVGAPQFIVEVSQSPNYPGPWSQREPRAIWNQAWFNSLRSAAGVERWARRTADADLHERARKTLEFALAAPQRDGAFPAVFTCPGTEQTTGTPPVLLRRPLPWSAAHWSNSNRVPYNYGVTPEWYHVLDASYTALLMLRWNAELGADPRLVDYARAWGDRLLALQRPGGHFPTWLHPETLAASPVLVDSPEDAQSVTFLLKLAEVTGDARYRAAALRALDAVLAGPAAEGRWEDFEAYWSCSVWGQGPPRTAAPARGEPRASDDVIGRRIERNAMYKQNNLGMFWTAEACLAAWRATGEARYLAWGRRALDELSMTQACWQPPFMPVPVLGGFGVMNLDGEWNDSRQSLFAELFLDYAVATDDPLLFERGTAALKAGFNMMYCPENPQTKAQYEQAFPFFGPADYGFMGENYGHVGNVSERGEGVAGFTIYDWGNGAASEGRNRIFDHYGDVYIDLAHGRAYGIDSIAAEALPAGGWRLRDLADQPRTIRLVRSDGTSATLHLTGTVDVD